MDNTIAEWRRAERVRLLAARQKPDAAAFADWSDAITERLVVLVDAFAPKMLGFYWPHRGEYDPMTVVNAQIDHGGQVALPALAARAQPLEYRRWYPGGAMAPGKFSFGIPEPTDGPVVTPDLMLVPLLGFDRDGYRLGYGGGYFDRTLAAYRVRPRTIGVGYELGRLPTIHPQPHDIALDVIVTEAGDFPTG
jgi:5-formyltetrahydrofolate cyclo-ligase